MKTIQYKFIDKSKWPRGEWDDEPDKVQWQENKFGFPCLAVRNPLGGNWCGYVGVPESHPYFGKEYGEVNILCHGGLTFSDLCAPEDREHGICHIVEEGEDDRVWWLGFDCGHGGDVLPNRGTVWLLPGEYRTLEFVQIQCYLIAMQLFDVKRHTID